MKYNLSKIMLKAWKVYRKTKNISFAEALHRAWLSAKAEEINTGRTPLVVIGAKGLRREAPGPAGGEPAIVCGGLPARAARTGGRRAAGALWNSVSKHLATPVQQAPAAITYIA